MCVRFDGLWFWVWWRMVFILLMIVWFFVGMVFMILYNIFIVGFVCWFGFYIVYGFFIFGFWFLLLLLCYKYFDNWMRVVVYVFNGLVFFIFIFIIFVFFSGIFNNCICKGGLVGYLDFESVEFYWNLNYFNVYKWWMVGVIVGVLFIIFSLFRVVWLLI